MITITDPRNKVLVTVPQSLISEQQAIIAATPGCDVIASVGVKGPQKHNAVPSRNTIQHLPQDSSKGWCSEQQSGPNPHPRGAGTQPFRPTIGAPTERQRTRELPLSPR